MRLVCRVTNDGFFVEDVILQDDEETPADCVNVQPAQGFYWPKWNGAAWVEGGGLWRQEPDGKVNPAKRFDPIVTDKAGSTIERGIDGIVKEKKQTPVI